MLLSNFYQRTDIASSQSTPQNMSWAKRQYLGGDMCGRLSKSTGQRKSSGLRISESTGGSGWKFKILWNLPNRTEPQSSKCYSSDILRVCLLLAGDRRGQVQQPLASHPPPLPPLQPSLRHPYQVWDHRERQQEILFYIVVIPIILFRFSDSSGRHWGMWRKRLKMDKSVMTLYPPPPKDSSLNWKEERPKDWFGSIRLTSRCGATRLSHILSWQRSLCSSFQLVLISRGPAWKEEMVQMVWHLFINSLSLENTQVHFAKIHFG